MTRLLLAVAVVSSAGADWPQFLGPTRDGASPEAVAPWKGDPKPLWKVPVGPGHSSPVVVGGRVYLFSQPKGQDAESLSAFDAATGEKLYETPYPRPKFSTPFGTGPQSTPTVTGGKVYTYGSTGLLTAFDADTGKQLWQVDVLKRYAGKNLYFGTSTSPLVADGKVIVLAGGKGAGVVAVNAADGEPAWQSTDDPASYASPVLAGGNVVALTGSHVRALDLATGKEVWAQPFKDRLNESSTTPVVVGTNVVASSVTRGSISLDVAGAEPKKLWTAPELTCYFSTPVVVGERLYMVNGAATLVGASITLRCVELKTGKVVWEKPKLGKYHAALLKLKGGNVLVLDDIGRLTLLDTTASEYKTLATAKICGETWAHPALVDGVVYVRDEKELVAVRIKPE